MTMHKRTLAWIFLAAAILTVASSAYSQEPTPTPPDVPTVEQLLTENLTLQDENAALKQQVAAQEEAVKALTAEVATIKLEVAKKTGELTGREQTIVRLDAIVQFLLTNGRKKIKVGLINF